VKEKEELQEKKKAQEDLAAEKLKGLHAKAKTIGNYVHESVPIHNNEDFNEVQRTWAPEERKAEKKEDGLAHHEILYRLGAVDYERGVKIVGHRGYCLTDMGVFLNGGCEYIGARETC
jgi:seryl-tRNA synthetase